MKCGQKKRILFVVIDR